MIRLVVILAFIYGAIDVAALWGLPTELIKVGKTITFVMAVIFAIFGFWYQR